MTRVRAEVRWLIHVYPEGVNIDTLRVIEKYAELVGPEVLGRFVKPVGIDCRPRPDNGLIDGAIAMFEEGVDFSSSIIGVIVLDDNG
jgi:hypothetical protein